MAARTFKGRKIECDYIAPPYLSGVVGKPEMLQTNIICIGAHHGEKYLTGIAKRSFTSGRKRTGWRSEDGTIPPLYRANMQEHASANYLGRTRRNVVDSHATLIITNAYPLSGGTLKTRFFCEEMMRSHFVVSLGESDAVGKVQRWLVQFFAQEHPVPFVLNVAGPRESKAGGIQKRTRHFQAEVLQGMLENAGSNGAALEYPQFLTPETGRMPDSIGRDAFFEVK